MAGNQEDIDKFSRRLVKVTRTHCEEAKTLLKLMGVPYVEAPCEAEAQCAALAKAGKASVWLFCVVASLLIIIFIRLLATKFVLPKSATY